MIDHNRHAHWKNDPSSIPWQNLIFGSFSHDDVAASIIDPSWQTLRVRLLGTPLLDRYEHLFSFVSSAPSTERRRREICVTNYIHSLRRGGLIPL